MLHALQYSVTQAVSSRGIALVHFSVEVVQLFLKERSRVSYALVVDGRSQFSNEEVNQGQCPKITQRLVELGSEVRLERVEQCRAPLR